MQEGDTFLLPEGCITNILSLTSPRDACTSALVSSTFKSAADSDVVWGKFLPPDYKDIISRSVCSINLNDFSSKKELYFRLCNDPILIDCGKKSFKLEKETGKKCFTIGAKELSITWGDTPQYWDWISRPDSRFAEVAELKDVCWFEIRCKTETRMLSPKTNYAAYVVIKYGDSWSGLSYPPAEASVEFVVGGGCVSGARNVYLKQGDGLRRRSRRFGHRFGLRSEEDQSSSDDGLFPSERGDGWMEIELGEFYNDKGEDGEVEISVKEVKGGHWKRGLIVEGIELRPKLNTT